MEITSKSCSCGHYTMLCGIMQEKKQKKVKLGDKASGHFRVSGK